MRVLLIEDDPQLRQVLAVFFRSIGGRVEGEMSDGQEALKRLSNLSVDLIVTDMQMPRMDGIDFVRHLRRRGDRTPVIMMSGQSDVRLIASAKAAGVNCYLPKPLSVTSLNLAILQTLRGTAA